MLMKSNRLTPDYPGVSFSLVLQVHLPPPGTLNYPHAYSSCVQTKDTVEADECHLLI